MSLQVKGVQIA